MAVVGFAGAEGWNFDLANREAEKCVGGGNVTIAAGSLRTGGKGSQHYVCDASGSAFGGLLSSVANQCGAGSGATKQMAIAVVQIDLVTTPAFDTPVMTADIPANSFEVRYERLTDGKIHFFVKGVEINSAAAFTPTTGSPIGLAVVLALDNVHESELWYDSTANGTFVKQQHGVSGTAPSATGSLSFCETLAKGVNHNWRLQVDDVVLLDNGGSYNTVLPTLGAGFTYYECVKDGVPNADTGTNQWNDSTGVVCGTGGNCNPSQGDKSDTTYIQITTSPATRVDADQTFPTSHLVVNSGDTVYAAGMGLKGRIANANGWAQTCIIVDGGTKFQQGGSSGTTNMQYANNPPYYDHSPKSNVAWTVALMQAMQIGTRISGGSGPAAVDFRNSELFKFVCYKPGTTPTLNLTSEPQPDRNQIRVVAY